MGKNVAVFVDVANIFYAAKAAGTDIDYVTLLQAATAGRDFVRAYAYTGLDPDNENQRNFHAFLARNSYKVVSKDIRKYGDGKVKANLDIELVVDLMKTARNLDIAIVISGDGDFAPAIRAVQEMGVRVEVISFRGNTSSDLIEVADLFTDITQLARVDKASSRSGRRVASDQEDLSMTEVPDKQTEGTGQRSRGRGRGRGRAGEAEPVAARTRTSSRSAGREPTAIAAIAPIAAPSAAPAGNGALTVMPGEKLSRVAPAGAASAAAEAAPIDGLVTTDDEELTPFDAAAEIGEGGGPGSGSDENEIDGDGEARRRR
ncbi:MAG: NYN domain-containing protein, partial [Chloroflexi bacterium]|nr:NYN domain-containing protein [Chloroflexota bacterium]